MRTCKLPCELRPILPGTPGLGSYLYQDFSRGHNAIPVSKPMSILKMALLSIILTVAHTNMMSEIHTGCHCAIGFSARLITLYHTLTTTPPNSKASSRCFRTHGLLEIFPGRSLLHSLPLPRQSRSCATSVNQPAPTENISLSQTWG